MIKRNPCRIKGAGQEESPERPTLTIPQVYALADAVGQRYRALVLLAMFSSLRWGELGALRRCDIDLEARTVRVTRQLARGPRRRLRVRATQVQGRYARPCRSRADHRRPSVAPGVLRPAGDEGAGVHQPGGHAAASQQLPAPRLAPRSQRGWAYRHPLSRPEAHRKHPGGHRRGDPPRADGPHGPRQRARRA